MIGDGQQGSRGVWSTLGVVLGPLPGVYLLGILARLGGMPASDGDGLVGRVVGMMVLLLGAPLGAFLFGHVYPSLRVWYDPSLDRYSELNMRAGRLIFRCMVVLIIVYSLLLYIEGPYMEGLR